VPVLKFLCFVYGKTGHYKKACVENFPTQARFQHKSDFEHKNFVNEPTRSPTKRSTNCLWWSNTRPTLEMCTLYNNLFRVKIIQKCFDLGLGWLIFCMGKFQTSNLVMPGCLKDVKHHYQQLLFHEF
jgi:hypothetical protein